MDKRVYDVRKVLAVINELPDEYYRPTAAEFFSTKLRDEAVLSKLLDCCEMYLPRFIKLLKDKDEGIAEKAFIGAHNFSTEKHGRAVLLRAFLTTEASNGIVRMLWLLIVSKRTDRVKMLATTLMVNLTTDEHCVVDIVSLAPAIEKVIGSIVFQLIDKEPKKSDIRQYLSHLLLNLTVLMKVRKYLIHNERYLLWFITSLLNDQKCDKSCFGIIKNLTFDTESHIALFVRYYILGKLLYHLAGNEVYPDEEAIKLSKEVRCMLPSKTRNEDEHIRCTILETLYQLGATAQGREFMRSRNAYIILRDYHKWERSEQCLDLCENVVNVLIRTEDEIEVDNIRTLEIPVEKGKSSRRRD